MPKDINLLYLRDKMIFTLQYCLKNPEGAVSSQGEAKCEITKDSFSVLPKFGEPLYFSLRDIINASQENYKINLSLTSKETLILSDLGYQFEDFLHLLLKERNVMVLEDELIKEKPRKSFSHIEYVYSTEKTEHKSEGELKIFSDKLVLIAKDHELIKIYLNEISSIEDKDYSVIIRLQDSNLRLIKLGEQYDYLVNLLSQVINALSLSVQKTLQELFPTINPSTIRMVARLLKEGRAAKKTEIEAISPSLWEAMENKLAKLEIKGEYDFLTALTDKDTVSIGLKKDRGIEYLWFLVPIYNQDKNKPGNAIALESATAEDGGKATYFFRIMPRSEYKTKPIKDIVTEVNSALGKINDAMIQTNFKREPIYLPEEKLAGTAYEVALKKMPDLNKLRELFIGRVIHRSPEQWQEDVGNLLNFNINGVNDQEKWQKEE